MQKVLQEEGAAGARGGCSRHYAGNGQAYTVGESKVESGGSDCIQEILDLQSESSVSYFIRSKIYQTEIIGQLEIRRTTNR